MKLITFFQIACILFCFTGFTACNDDDGFPPLTLLYIEGEHSPIQENSLTINTFDEDGISFRIVGGDNGRYVIHNSDPNIIDCNYNGDILTLIPRSNGNATVKITDYSGNSYTLQVEVTYPTQVYPIQEIQAEVEGGGLTGNEIQEIKTDIISRIPVKEGGKYIFTFGNKEQTYGSVKIYPSEYSNPLEGNFRYVQAEGYEYTIIKIELWDGTSYSYTLKPYSSTSQTEEGLMTLQEDITNIYKGKYPALEKAYSYQIFPNVVAAP